MLKEEDDDEFHIFPALTVSPYLYKDINHISYKHGFEVKILHLKKVKLHLLN